MAEPVRGRIDPGVTRPFRGNTVDPCYGAPAKRESVGQYPTANGAVPKAPAGGAFHSYCLHLTGSGDSSNRAAKVSEWVRFSATGIDI